MQRDEICLVDLEPVRGAESDNRRPDRIARSTRRSAAPAPGSVTDRCRYFRVARKTTNLESLAMMSQLPKIRLSLAWYAR